MAEQDRAGTSGDSVRDRKTAAAQQAGDNHEVGVNADEPSTADSAQDEQVEDTPNSSDSGGETDPVTGQVNAPGGRAAADDAAAGTDRQPPG